MSRRGAKVMRLRVQQQQEASAWRVWLACVDAIGMTALLGWFRLQ